MSKVNPNQGKGRPPKKEDLPNNEEAVVDEAEERIETPEDEETKALFLEASKLVLHILNWVQPQHELFYKVAYLQVKNDPKVANNPARVRSAIIKQLMNRIITKMGKFFKEENEKKEKKNVSRRF